jgi:hypothetical protein
MLTGVLKVLKMTQEINEKSFIKVYDDLITANDCDAAIEYFKKEKKFQRTFSRFELENANVTQKADTATTINSDNFENVFAEGPELKNLFINLNNVFRIYLKETKILDYLSCGEIHWQPVKIQKTLPGGGYHLWHAERVGTNLNHLLRVLVFTLYLNDIEEGGETEFLLQNMRVKPKKGRLCFFPAHFPYLHRGNPPLAGEKYIMTSWFNMTKFD